MSTETDLDLNLNVVIKGSPPPNKSLESVAKNALESRASSPDPVLNIPASPTQIYLNLLILEASLRSQYLTLRARRRQNTFVLTILALWIGYFFYCQFLRPREDGTGVGGSVYWLLDMFEKVALISGLVMSILFRLTGQWERGVRWPSRWLRTTNRGLRGMNCKVVVLKGPWWKEFISSFGFLLPISYFVETPGSNYQFIEYPAHERRMSQPVPKKLTGEKGKSEVAEEDIATGGDYVKILLLPKHFTPEFRENWEVYRAEYWDLENQRRADIRIKVRAKLKALARQRSPWFWWLPGRPATLSRSASHQKHDSMHNSTVARTPSTRHKRATSIIKEREPKSHSRSSSRSSAVAEPDERERRWSTSTTSSIGGERRRRKIGSVSGETDSRRTSMIGPSGRVKLSPSSGGSRPTTPTSSDASRMRVSAMTAVNSNEGDSPGRRIKTEPLD